MAWLFGEGTLLFVSFVMWVCLIIQWRVIYCYNKELKKSWKEIESLKNLKNIEGMVDEFNLRGVGKHGDES